MSYSFCRKLFNIKIQHAYQPNFLLYFLPRQQKIFFFKFISKLSSLFCCPVHNYEDISYYNEIYQTLIQCSYACSITNSQELMKRYIQIQNPNLKLLKSGLEKQLYQFRVIFYSRKRRSLESGHASYQQLRFLICW